MTPLRAIVSGTLVVGSLDIAYAITFWSLRNDVAPTRILQSVAAGLLGRDAFQGGLVTALLGLALHFFIAFSIVVVYWLVSRKIDLLVRRPIVCGAIYGLLVYLFMNYVVIPLSAATPSRFLASWVILSVLVHMLLVGVPAGLFARAASTGKEPQHG